MAVAAELLLLMALIPKLHADTLIRRGESYVINLDKTADLCSISRLIGQERKLLWNSSVLQNNGTGVSEMTPYQMVHLDYSDSGRYQVQCWTRGNVTHEENPSLLVCNYKKTHSENVILRLGESGMMTCAGARADQNVQWISSWFNPKTEGWEFGVIGSETYTVSKFQAATIDSTLQVTASVPAQGAKFDCLGMKGQECALVHRVHVHALPEYIYRSEDESLELNCSDVRGVNPPKWKIDNAAVDGEKQAFNYTLMIPSLTPAHSGTYKCAFSLNEEEVYNLIVCPKTPPPAVALFTGGENLTLECGADAIDYEFIYWFMKSNRSEGRTSYVDNYYPPQEKLSRAGINLVISNVSVEDGGEFWCAAVVDEQCVFSTKTLVKYREPASVYSVVRSLLISVLLIMMSVVVAVVIWRSWSPVRPALEVQMRMSDLLSSESPVS